MKMKSANGKQWAGCKPSVVYNSSHKWEYMQHMRCRRRDQKMNHFDHKAMEWLLTCISFDTLKYYWWVPVLFSVQPTRGWPIWHYMWKKCKNSVPLHEDLRARSGRTTQKTFWAFYVVQGTHYLHTQTGASFLGVMYVIVTERLNVSSLFTGYFIYPLETVYGICPSVI